MRPAGPMLLLLGFWLLLAVPASLRPEPWLGAWQAAGGALALAVLADALLALGLPGPELERSVPAVLPVGVWTSVRLRLRGTRRRQRLRLFDGVPAELEISRLPLACTLAPAGRAELEYQVRPRLRGACAFEPASLLLASPLGLWWRPRRAGAAQPLKVYPNFAPVRKYVVLAAAHRLDQLGIHRRRRRGEGSEFHQLRDYRPGDSLRQLDWKATARLRRLISRDYQEERDQQVVCLLDCGRRMRAKDGRLSLFDHALTALLLLAYVALREGDAVGLLGFASEPRWLPPGKGPAALDRLMEAVHDLQPGLQPTDFLETARLFLARQSKRSLVVLVTCLREEDDDTLGPALALLRRRHRVILASLRDPELDRTLRRPVREFSQALRFGAVEGHLEARRRALARLDPAGAPLDVLPERLPAALVNRYLQTKEAGLV